MGRRPRLPGNLAINIEQTERKAKKVRRISQRLPPYPAEEQLFGILKAELGNGERSLPHRLWDVTDAHIPKSMHYRRIVARDHSFRPFPMTSAVVTMLEAFAEKSLDHENRRILGATLNRLRLEYWEEWALSADEEGIDIDTAPTEEMAKLRLLLRCGLTALDNLTIFQATSFLAHQLFPAELGALGPVEAIHEIITWAQANVPLREGQRQAIWNKCRAIWNTLLPPVSPTTSMVSLVRGIYPVEPLVADWSPTRAVKIRHGCVRLLCRLLAQAESWGDDRVYVPVSWFMARQDPADPCSIIGVSTATFRRYLLEPLEQSGVLTLLEEGDPSRHLCGRYLLCLDREGQELPLGDAERQLEG